MSLAIVSGVTGGIGSVVARALWQVGYSIVGLGRNEAVLEEMHQWFLGHPQNGVYAQTLVYDVLESGDQNMLRYIINTMADAPTVLVACHGHPPLPIDASDTAVEAAARKVFDTDVIGTLRLCQLVAPAMRHAGGGSISIVSSLHSRATYPNRAPYSMAKAAMGGLVRSLALDWGKDNIRTNAILAWQCTGSRTAQVARSESGDTLERYLQKSPLRRLVEPQDVARTVLWLAQNESITGSEIVIDCGVSASMWHRGFLPDEL